MSFIKRVLGGPRSARKVTASPGSGGKPLSLPPPSINSGSIPLPPPPPQRPWSALPPVQPQSEGILEKSFRLQYITQLGDLINQTISNILPAFGHSIVVGVRGGPTATLQDIWKLALATAFGRYRRHVRGTRVFSGGDIECVWNITDKSCVIKLSYTLTGTAAAVVSGRDPINGQPVKKEYDGIRFILAGPTEETVGGRFNEFLEIPPGMENRPNDNAGVVGGVPVVPAAGVNPDDLAQDIKDKVKRQLPDNENGAQVLQANIKKPLPIKRPGVNPFAPLTDEGRLITTRIKSLPYVQPPQPPGNFDLVKLVSNALTNPCYLPAYPPSAVSFPQPAEGVKFFQPGQTIPADLEDQILNLVLANETPNQPGIRLLPRGQIVGDGRSHDGYAGEPGQGQNQPIDVTETPNPGTN